MGDPKKPRSNVRGPGHPWNKERIDEEKPIMRDYGLKNKKEVWKASSLLNNYKENAKKLIGAKDEKSEISKQFLLKKLVSLGVLGDGAHLDDVLGLTMENILDRRLQSIVLKKGFARTVKQSRQFIVHEHVTVNGKKITSPSYLVPLALEESVGFLENSNLIDEEHPERMDLGKLKELEEKKASLKKASEEAALKDAENAKKAEAEAPKEKAEAEVSKKETTEEVKEEAKDGDK